MKIVKRLIAHGCSFTYGEELTEPSSSSWPVLVANELDVECLNLAKPSYSNDAMVQDIVRLDPNWDDLVIICWSSYLRMYLRDDSGWYTTVLGKQSEVEWQKRNRIIEDLRSTNSDEWLYERWLIQMILLQNFLDSKGIKYLFFNAFDNQSRHETYKKKFYSLHDRINRYRFIGWPSEGFVDWARNLPTGPRGHPLEEGHERAAAKVLAACKEVHDLPRIIVDK